MHEWKLFTSFFVLWQKIKFFCSCTLWYFMEGLFASILLKLFAQSPFLPSHVAFIMDGNRRYAKEFLSSAFSVSSSSSISSLNAAQQVLLQHFSVSSSLEFMPDLPLSTDELVMLLEDAQKTRHIGHVMGFHRLERVILLKA
jgi:hypothetical protein